MTRGTWQGSGTFKTNGPDPSVVVAVLVAVLFIGGGGAGAVAAVASAVTSLLVIAAIVVGVLVLAGVVVLFFVWRATRRREAKYAVSERHQRIMAEATRKPQVAKGTAPAIENHYHVHYHGADGAGAPRVLPGKVLP